MYESYYRFSAPPFLAVPDPGFLFLSQQHKRALSLLQYALLSRAGFCVITGDVGAGKTTLVRRLLEDVGPDVTVGLVSNTTCNSFEEFLKWILLSFGLEYRNNDKVQLYDDFVRFLILKHNQGGVVTLVIDEAQNLATQYLEQLRMMSNINTEKGLILQVILVGQPGLWKTLRAPELEQFAQRIAYDYRLEPFKSMEVVGEYIRHRLTFAGGEPELFRDDTYPIIFRATRGVPRLINLLCDAALVYGYAEQQEFIDARMVELVLKDKKQGLAPLTRDGETLDGREDLAPVRTRPERSTIERAIQIRKPLSSE